MAIVCKAAHLEVTPKSMKVLRQQSLHAAQRHPEILAPLSKLPAQQDEVTFQMQIAVWP